MRNYTIEMKVCNSPYGQSAQAVLARSCSYCGGYGCPECNGWGINPTDQGRGLMELMERLVENKLREHNLANHNEE